MYMEVCENIFLRLCFYVSLLLVLFLFLCLFEGNFCDELKHSWIIVSFLKITTYLCVRECISYKYILLFVNNPCTFLVLLVQQINIIYIFTNAPTVNTYECEGYVPPKYIKHANPATKRPQQPAPVK